MAKRQKKPAEKPIKKPTKPRGTVVVSLGPVGKTAESEPRQQASEPRDRVRDWEPLKQALEKYQSMAHLLMEQQLTTNTPGWQAAYAAEMERHTKTITAFAKQIKGDAAAIETNGISEATEKAIKDSVKLLTNEREGHQAWLARQIQPLIDLCNKALGVIDQLIADAKNIEAAQPLLYAGLTGHVRDQVNARMPRWDWDPKSGRVVRTEEYVR
jgi:hypothetical protein